MVHSVRRKVVMHATAYMIRWSDDSDSSTNITRGFRWHNKWFHDDMCRKGAVAIALGRKISVTSVKVSSLFATLELPRAFVARDTHVAVPLIAPVIRWLSQCPCRMGGDYGGQCVGGFATMPYGYYDATYEEAPFTVTTRVEVPFRGDPVSELYKLINGDWSDRPAVQPGNTVVKGELPGPGESGPGSKQGE